MEPYIAKIPDLLLDDNNPRLDAQGRSQKELLAEVVANQGDKIIVLARHIAQNGTNPLDRIGVIRSKEKGRYIVIEGNRRIAALKLLHHQALVDEVASSSFARRFKAACRGAEPPSQVDVVIFSSREEGDPWIRLRHTGENEGGGIVPWGALEVERYHQRSGKTSPALHVVDWFESSTKGEAEFEDLRSKLPFTTLKRLLDDKTFRKSIGLHIEGSNVSALYPSDEILKPMRRIVRDLLSGDTKVRHVYKASDRQDYLAGFKASELPNPNTELQNPAELQPATGRKAAAGKKGKKKKKRDEWSLKNFEMNISETKVAEMFASVARIPLDRNEILHSVMLRVFLEATLHVYITREKITSVTKDAPLRDKIKAVAKHMLDANTLTKNEYEAFVRTAYKEPENVLTTATLNAWVHNEKLHPNPREIEAFWNNLRPALETIWR